MDRGVWRFGGVEAMCQGDFHSQHLQLQLGSGVDGEEVLMLSVVWRQLTVSATNTNTSMSSTIIWQTRKGPFQCVPFFQ
jgi:hypothetical protein